MVYLILGEGFEESEAIIPCDLLRRAGVEVRLAGIGGLEISGSHGIVVRADCAAETAALTDAEMIILPGGLGGVRSIQGCGPVLEAVRALYTAGGFVAAICAAPAILAQLGITEGRKAVCYPGMEAQMGGARDVRRGHGDRWPGDYWTGCRRLFRFWPGSGGGPLRKGGGRESCGGGCLSSLSR